MRVAPFAVAACLSWTLRGAEPHSPKSPVPKSSVAATADACNAFASVAPELFGKEGSAPTDVKGWLDRLGGFGKTNAVLVPFSRAPGRTSLGNPRILATVSTVNPRSLARVEPATREPDVRDRLFVAFNAHPDGTRTLEFIAWNRRLRRFDFGIVENYDKPERRRVVADEGKRRECLSCHKAGGPIFTEFPWGGTHVDPLMSLAMLKRAHASDPKTYAEAKPLLGRIDDPAAKSKELEGPYPFRYFLDGKDTGVPFFDSAADGRGINRTGVYDGSVRDATERRLRSEALLRALPPESRAVTARALMLEAIGDRDDEKDPLLARSKALFAAAAIKAGPAGRKPLPESFSSFIRSFDFSKEKQGFHLESVDEKVSHVKDILTYDERRLKEGLKLPKGRRESEAEAFGDFVNFKQPARLRSPAELLAEGLPQAPHLFSDPSRDLLRLFLRAAGKDRAAVFEAALGDPAVSKVLKRGLPEEGNLLPPLVAALREEFRRRGLDAPDDAKVTELMPKAPAADPCADGDAAEAPGASPVAEESSCAACHGPDKPGILRFPFDPADADAWRKAVGGASAEKRRSLVRRLQRVVERLGDKTMPPEDSAEALRLGDPTRRKDLERRKADLEKLLKEYAE